MASLPNLGGGNGRCGDLGFSWNLWGVDFIKGGSGKLARVRGRGFTCVNWAEEFTLVYL